MSECAILKLLSRAAELHRRPLPRLSVIGGAAGHDRRNLQLASGQSCHSCWHLATAEERISAALEWSCVNFTSRIHLHIFEALAVLSAEGVKLAPSPFALPKSDDASCVLSLGVPH